MSKPSLFEPPPAKRKTDRDLFLELAAGRSRQVRNMIVERHIGFARHVARPYRSRGLDQDDIDQIALLGLVKAVDRFNPDLGPSFLSFARPTIEGELKRHFRDRSWALKVPRSMKELNLNVRHAIEALHHELGRTPTVNDIAGRLEVTADVVRVAMAAAAAYSVDSVSAPRYVDTPCDDERLEATPDRLLARQLVDTLPAREREMVRLRYSAGLSQSAIGARMGVSQMQVSRMLRRSIDQLSRVAGAPGADVDEAAGATVAEITLAS